MEHAANYRIITNNPLVQRRMSPQYLVEFRAEADHRDVLVRARDLVYAGHRLYTHPLAGSVKPNETPYKSIVVSRLPQTMAYDEAMLVASGLETFDRFKPLGRVLTEQAHRDLQLIDYTLLCGALQVDAAGTHLK